MAIEIHNIRLPVDIERGASGGPMFSTTITETDNGRESSNINWTYPLREFDISYPLQERDGNIDDVITFFYARRGRAYGFLFKDWSDFSFPETLIGTGTGLLTTFQLKKVYNDAVSPFELPITRPVSGTVQIWAGGLLQTETTDYTVDYTTGIVTFNTPPGGSVLVTAACEYNIPVRFDTDKLNMNIEWYDAIAIDSLIVKEIRE